MWLPYQQQQWFSCSSIRVQRGLRGLAFLAYVTVHGCIQKCYSSIYTTQQAFSTMRQHPWRHAIQDRLYSPTPRLGTRHFALLLRVVARVGDTDRTQRFSCLLPRYVTGCHRLSPYPITISQKTQLGNFTILNTIQLVPFYPGGAEPCPQKVQLAVTRNNYPGATYFGVMQEY